MGIQKIVGAAPPVGRVGQFSVFACRGVMG
jgi:hypothetical protein